MLTAWTASQLVTSSSSLPSRTRFSTRATGRLVATMVDEQSAARKVLRLVADIRQAIGASRVGVAALAAVTGVEFLPGG